MRRIFLLLLSVCLLLSACAPAAAPQPEIPNTPQPEASTTPQPDAPKTPQVLQPSPVSTGLFQVIKPDGSSVGFTWDDLKKLPLANITVDGKVEEGVRLSDVLKTAGVIDYSEVSLSGTSNPATLTRDQVEDNAILDFTNHGTVKLSSTYIPKPQWTKDVSEIKVK